MRIRNRKGVIEELEGLGRDGKGRGNGMGLTWGTGDWDREGDGDRVNYEGVGVSRNGTRRQR